MIKSRMVEGLSCTGRNVIRNSDMLILSIHLCCFRQLLLLIQQLMSCINQMCVGTSMFAYCLAVYRYTGENGRSIKSMREKPYNISYVNADDRLSIEYACFTGCYVTKNHIYL